MIWICVCPDAPYHDYGLQAWVVSEYPASEERVHLFQSQWFKRLFLCNTTLNVVAVTGERLLTK